MGQLSQLIYLQAQWVQPKASQNRFELRAGDQIFAVLEFPKLFGSLANGSSNAGRWTFKRVGFFKPKVTVRAEGSDTDLAIFQLNWTGTEGVVQFTDETRWLWKPANFWATQYAWQNTAGKTLIIFKQGVEDQHLSDLFKLQAQVILEPEAQSVANLDLLVMLGWYLLILKQQDDTTAIVATTTV